MFYTHPLALLCCLYVFGLSQIQAQTHNHPHPCGTADTKSEWLQTYQRNPAAFAQYHRSPTIVYVPMSLHLVGQTNGDGVVDLDLVLNSFCRLNQDFAASNIQFFIQFPIHYHYRDSWYSHDSVIQGGRMMLQENIANTVNVYFVSSPAGNCGYNLPYAGIAMNVSCLSGHTFAHEMGHCLGLPHTFFGWEGGIQWNSGTVTSFPRPAPLRVTYNYTDFKDSMVIDTLIIDTANVEFVARTGARANCQNAGDGFCDTEADYLAYRWQCNAQGNSMVQQLDPDSVAFFSKGEYIMSYADDNCQNRFTTEQMNAMNAFLQTRRSQWLGNQNPTRTPITAGVNLLSPTLATNNPSTGTRFVWNTVPNATHYYIEIYKEPYAPNQIIERRVLTDTSYTPAYAMNPRNANFPYGWRVRAFNQGYACTQYSNILNYNTTLVTGVETLASNTGFRVFPNPSPIGQHFGIVFDSPTEQIGTLSVHNMLGQSLSGHKISLAAGENTYQLANLNLSQGTYLVSLQTATQKYTVKLLVE